MGAKTYICGDDAGARAASDAGGGAGAQVADAQAGGGASAQAAGACADGGACVDASTSQIGATMEALFNTINARKGADADAGSYTKSLFDGKLDNLLKKVSEESLESCLAAKECEMLKRSLDEWANVAKVADTGGAVTGGMAVGNKAADNTAVTVNVGPANDAPHTQLPPDDLPINDPDSHPITRTMQGFTESMQLAQAIHECNQIQKTSRELDEGVDHLRYEAADVIYHLLVLLARFDVPLDELAAELNMRMREDERPKGCVMLHPDHVQRGK